MARKCHPFGVEKIPTTLEFRNRKPTVASISQFQIDISLLLDSFLIGVLLIITFYRLALYRAWKKDRIHLVYALFCGVMLLRVALTGERVLIGLFPGFDWPTQMRLEHLTFYCAGPLFLLFLGVLLLSTTI